MSNLDEYYQYDWLNRLTQMQRGTLNSDKTGITGTPVLEQDWSLDSVGNWGLYQNKVSGTTTLNQTRSHNSVNEITAISSTPSWPTPPMYDAAGNTSFFPSVQNPEAAMSGTYDAWNRLVEVDSIDDLDDETWGSSSGSGGGSSSSSGPSVLSRYSYDGLNRRITSSENFGTHWYFSSNWQALEVRPGSAYGFPYQYEQYVWGIRYVDELILRDRLLNVFAGRLDPSFGDGGTVVTNFGSGTGGFNTVMMVGNQIVAAGNYNGDLAVARFNPDGTPDSSFGSGGIATVSFSGDGDAQSLVAVSGGFILAAGKTTSGSAGNAVLAMFNSDGSLYSGFGTGGKVITSLSSEDNGFFGVGLQSDGNILACGYADVSGNSQFAVARYESGGSLDSSFGSGGISLIAPGTSSIAQSMGLITSGTEAGRMFVVGSVDGSMGIVQLDTDGGQNLDWGASSGKTIVNFGGTDGAWAVGGGGLEGLLMAGQGNGNFAMVEMDENNGSVGATATTDFGSTTAAYNMAINTYIYLAGSISSGVALARYFGVGELDEDFGIGGKVTTNFGGSLDEDEIGLIIQSDGKIVIAAGIGGNFVLARYYGANTASERLYVCQDANWNVTSLVNTSGSVVEHYNYTPYGVQSVYSASWEPEDESSYNWLVGHQGLFVDDLSELYYNRNRWMHPQLGRFMSRDPLGYVDGLNLYEYERDNPISYQDFKGTVIQQIASTQDSDTNQTAQNGNTGGNQPPGGGAIPVGGPGQYCGQSVPPSAAACSQYPCTYSYSFASAICFCENSPDDQWSNFVRGCLLCEYSKGTNPNLAHDSCYQQANNIYPGQMPWASLWATYLRCL